MTKPIASLAQLEQVLRASGYAHRAGVLKSVARPCLRLVARRAEEGDIPIGASKLGGSPDVPRSFEWPGLRSRRPLSFIAQMNLGDLPRIDEPPSLPSSGKLLFFCDPLGRGESGRLRSSVVHVPARASRLGRLSGPKDAMDIPSTDVLDSCKLVFRRILSFPPLPPFACSESEAEWYMEQLSLRPNSGAHQMFGFPGTLQPTRDERHDLLLQIDSDPDLDLRWGVQGRLFYWMPRPSRSNAAFDRAWATMQE